MGLECDTFQDRLVLMAVLQASLPEQLHLKAQYCSGSYTAGYMKYFLICEQSMCIYIEL